jgi:hypothetical protein
MTHLSDIACSSVLPVLTACLTCASGTGRSVRAAVFGPELAANLAAVLAPVPVLVAIALAVRFLVPGPSPREPGDGR